MQLQRITRVVISEELSNFRVDAKSHVQKLQRKQTELAKVANSMSNAVQKAGSEVKDCSQQPIAKKSSELDALIHATKRIIAPTNAKLDEAVAQFSEFDMKWSIRLRNAQATSQRLKQKASSPLSKTSCVARPWTSREPSKCKTVFCQVVHVARQLIDVLIERRGTTPGYHCLRRRLGPETS